MKKLTLPKKSLIWLGVVVIYIGFFLWHNGLGIPLSENEIEIYLKRTIKDNPNLDTKELEMLREFMEADDGDAIIMVNAIKLYDKPQRVPGVSPTETSEEVLTRYTNFVMAYSLKRGGYPVLAGNAVMDSMEIWGIENAKKWTMAGMMRYRSRRDLMEMATNPEFRRLRKFKFAAIEKTLAFPVAPVIVVGSVDILVLLFVFSVAALLHLIIGFLHQEKRE